MSANNRQLSQNIHPTSLNHSPSPSAEFLSNIANNNFVSTNSMLTTITETKTIETIKEIPVIIEKFVDRPIIVERRVEVDRPSVVKLTKMIPVERNSDYQTSKTTYLYKDNPETVRRLDESTSEVINLKTEIENLRTQNTIIKNDRDEMRREKDQSERELVYRNSSHFHQKIENLENDKKNLSYLVQKKSEEFNSLQNDNIKLRNEVEMLKRQLDSDRNQMAKSKSEITHLTTKVETITQNSQHDFNNRVQSEVSKTISRMEKTQKDLIDQLEHERTEIEMARKQSLKNEELLKREIEFLKQSNSQLHHQIQTHQNENVILHEKIHDFGSTRSQKNDNELLKLKTQITEIVQSSEMREQEWEKEKSRLVTQIREVQTENQRNLRQTNESNDRILSIYKRDLLEAKQRINELENKNKTLGFELEQEKLNGKRLSKHSELLENQHSSIDISSLLEDRNRLQAQQILNEERIRDLETKLQISQEEFIQNKQKWASQVRNESGLKRNDSQETFENNDPIDNPQNGRNEAEILMRNNTIIIEHQLQAANLKIKQLKEKNKKTKKELMLVTFRLVSTLSEFERKIYIDLNSAVQSK